MLVRHRAPTWGIGLLALALGGCGGSEEAAPSADATTAEAYPALAASFGLDQADLNRILLDGAGRAIEEQSIKSFVIGTGIRRDAGLYLNRPILDIRALADESYLDTDLTTQSSDQASVRISSGKEGSSESSQWKLSVSSSLSFGGFGVQATGTGERKFTETKNSGAATIRFDKVTSGGKVRLITGNFANSADFSSYLIGTPLTGEQLRQYVDYSECRVGIFNSQRYVCELRITNGGVISPGGENVYGSVQVLNELQRIFSLSKALFAAQGSRHRDAVTCRG